MDTSTILIPIVLLLISFLLAWHFLGSVSGNDIVTESDGKKDSVYSKTIQPSSTRDGIEFSYTCWIRIDDFTYRYGNEKVIFVKGSPDLSVACPALLIDANTNSLLVKVDTFGAQETIPIVSVPSKKWLHVTITVNQESIKVYINGIMYANHTLTHLPRQNSASVVTSPSGGFAGKVASLQYHPQALAVSDIMSMAAQQPPISEKGAQVYPPYFDISWFTSGY